MDLTDSDGDFDANHLSGPTPGKIENNNNDGNDNNSDMDLVTSDDDDVALDIDVLVNEAKVNMRNWALAQDDEGFTGYAKVFTYTSMDEVCAAGRSGLPAMGLVHWASRLIKRAH